MKRQISMIIVVTGFAMALVPAEASAQLPIGGPGPLAQPTPAFSPYLNLLRQGNSPTLNYFGLVQPQLNFMGSVNNLNQQTYNEQQNINQLQTGRNNLPVTGHAPRFMNYGGYFLTAGRGGGGGGFGGSGGGFGGTSQQGRVNLGSGVYGTNIGVYGSSGGGAMPGYR